MSTSRHGQMVQAAGQVKNLHLLMDNCYANHGTTNARELADMLSSGADG